MKKLLVLFSIILLLSSYNYYMNCQVDKLGMDINHVCNDTVYYAIINETPVFLSKEQYDNYKIYLKKNCGWYGR